MKEKTYLSVIVFLFLLITLFSILCEKFIFGGENYYIRGKYSGRSNTYSGRTFYYNRSGQYIGKISNGHVYDGKGRYIGKGTNWHPSLREGK